MCGKIRYGVAIISIRNSNKQTLKTEEDKNTDILKNAGTTPLDFSLH